MVKEAYFHGKRGPLTEHAHTSGVPLSIQTAATMVFMTMMLNNVAPMVVHATLADILKSHPFIEACTSIYRGTRHATLADILKSPLCSGPT
jgi:hypothetical protein